MRKHTLKPRRAALATVQAIVESVAAACDTSCDCNLINSSIRLPAPDAAVVAPLLPFDPPDDVSEIWLVAGLVVLTEVPSAYVTVVVVDPSEFVAVWVVAPVISVPLSSDDNGSCDPLLP